MHFLHSKTYITSKLDDRAIQTVKNEMCLKGIYKYEGWNFNFGNTPLDWIQELLE